MPAPKSTTPKRRRSSWPRRAIPMASRCTLAPPTDDTPTTGRLPRALAGQLTKAGIQIELRLHPKTTFFDFVRPETSPALS